MEWLVTHEISKDPEIYGDEKKRQEYIRQKRQGLRAKIQEIPHCFLRMEGGAKG